MNNFNGLSDTINQIKISINKNFSSILIIYSKIKYNILNLLLKNFFIKNFFIFRENKKLYILIFFIIRNNLNSIQFINIISKSNLKLYSKSNKLPRLMNGLGVIFISTSLGLITDYLARRLGIGGKLICYVF